jgi:photosystem II stability/assembly factor-like uncharacterized protein
MSLAGCGEGENAPKLSGSGAGTILTYNGSSWASQVSGTTSQLNNVAFGNLSSQGQFVAVGYNGTILTSPDGSAWTSRTSQNPNGTALALSLYGVTYGNGQFVAVGDFGIILRSPDGINWSQPVPGNINSNPLNGVTYANGQFVAVGYSGIMYSSDGVNWNSISTQPSGITGPTVDLYSVTYGNGLFVTVGTYNSSSTNQPISYNGIIGTSPDGIDWTIVQYPPNYLSGVTYGGGQFVAVGREGIILTSPDGKTWTPQTAAPIANSTLTPYLINVIYTGTQYVVTGNYTGTIPSTGFILTSPDGINWTMPAIGTTSNLYGVCFGNGKIVTVGGE